MKSKDFWKRYLLKKKLRILILLTTINKMNMKTQMKRLNQTTLLPRLKIFKRINPSLKILKILKIFMLRLLFNNLSSIRNLLRTITTKDGSGCSSLGSVWLWNATTLISLENASLLLLHTCLLDRKDSSPAVIIILFRSPKDCSWS